MDSLAKLRAKIKPRNCSYTAVTQEGAFTITPFLFRAKQYLGENKRRVGLVFSGITYGEIYGVRFGVTDKQGALTVTEAKAAMLQSMNNNGYGGTYGGVVVRPVTVFKVCPINPLTVVLNLTGAGGYGNERTIFQGVRQ